MSWRIGLDSIDPAHVCDGANVKIDMNQANFFKKALQQGCDL
jgi:hypothetical protein